jgi:C4-dicarboxylate-specific signal transduction histidine kinase
MVQRFVKDHQGQLKLENDAEGHASVTLNLAVV